MEKLISIIVFVVVSATISVVTHRYLSEKNSAYFIPACLIAGVLSSFFFQIISYILLGYIDPFFIIAFISGTLFASGIALTVGLARRQFRKKTHNQSIKRDC